MDAGKGAQGASETAPASAEKPGAEPRWRLRRELVTLEADPGEEQVYGDATPVTVEWRKAKAEYKDAAAKGIVPTETIAEERMLVLGTAIIEEHEMKLPLAAYP